MPTATSFEKIETEKLSDRITREMLNGEDATLARIVWLAGRLCRVIRIAGTIFSDSVGGAEI